MEQPVQVSSYSIKHGPRLTSYFEKRGEINTEPVNPQYNDSLYNVLPFAFQNTGTCTSGEVDTLMNVTVPALANFQDLKYNTLQVGGYGSGARGDCLLEFRDTQDKRITDKTHQYEDVVGFQDVHSRITSNWEDNYKKQNGSEGGDKLRGTSFEYYTHVPDYQAAPLLKFHSILVKGVKQINTLLRGVSEFVAAANTRTVYNGVVLNPQVNEMERERNTVILQKVTEAHSYGSGAAPTLLLNAGNNNDPAVVVDRNDSVIIRDLDVMPYSDVNTILKSGGLEQPDVGKKDFTALAETEEHPVPHDPRERRTTWHTFRNSEASTTDTQPARQNLSERVDFDTIEKINSGEYVIPRKHTDDTTQGFWADSSRKLQHVVPSASILEKDKFHTQDFAPVDHSRIQYQEPSVLKKDIYKYCTPAEQVAKSEIIEKMQPEDQLKLIRYN
jgi:hypothetical protein